MSERHESTEDELQRDLGDALQPPSFKAQLDRPGTRQAVLLVVALLAGILAFVFLPGGDDDNAADEEVEREHIPPQRLAFDDPDTAAREAMHGLVAPVVSAVTGMVAPEAPALSPEELARLEYLAFQIGGPIRVEGDQQVGGGTNSASRYGGAYGTYDRSYGQAEVDRERSARNEYGSPTESAITATVRPQTLWYNETRILEGKRMPAILETPIDTTLPGPVRAVFTEDVYSESGDRILIPRYSEALGTAGNVRIQSGQDRVGVAWHRLLLRTQEGDGIVEVRLDSPATDALGRAGIKGNVNTHFWARFGNALLYTLIGTTASNVAAAQADAQNAQQAYLEDTTDAFRETAQESLREQDVHGPTITVPRATPITIVAAKDILFNDGQVEGVK